MKKFLSLLLSLCLAMGLATQAFAASTEVRFRSAYDAGGNPGDEDILDVVVPAEILLHMDRDGDIQVSRTLAIENKSVKAVEVKSIRVEGKNGWDIVDYDSDFSGKPADTKDLALSFRGDGTDDVGDVVPTPRNWDISAGDSILINAAAKMPTQAGTDRTGIATVYWNIDWVDDGPVEPGDGLVVTVLPGEHGSCDADEITTGSDGTISEFPGVTPDEGYLFDHWEDQEGNSVDENTVLDDGDSIRPVFKPDPDWKPDMTVTVPVLDGEHGSCDADEIMTGSDGKISEFPGVTPDEGYLFDHWEDQEGNPVDENTVLDDGDSIRPVFKSDPDWKPDMTVTVPVLDGEHGSCDVDEITTGSDGKISEFPVVTPDEGYLFDHWEDQDGNSVDENTVLDDGDSICPVFKPDSDWKPDMTVTVPVLDGEHGSCDVDEITTGSDGKISEFPGVTPDEGYLFDHWEDQDGNPVDENTVLDDGDSIRPVFKPDPDWKPDNTKTITIQQAEHGIVEPDSVKTDEDGKVQVLPQAVPDTGYRFIKFVDVSTGREVVLGDVLTEDITVRPVFESVGLVVSLAAGNGGTISFTKIENVPAGSYWGQLEKPTVTPVTGYSFDGWYNSDGEKMTSSTQILWSQTVTAKFVEIDMSSYFTYDGSVVTGFSETYLNMPNAPTDIVLPKQAGGATLTEVAAKAFMGRNLLTTVVIPSNYTKIGKQAFDGCRKADVYIENTGNVKYGSLDLAFRDCYYWGGYFSGDSYGPLNVFRGCKSVHVKNIKVLTNMCCLAEITKSGVPVYVNDQLKKYSLVTYYPVVNTHISFILFDRNYNEVKIPLDDNTLRGQVSYNKMYVNYGNIGGKSVSFKSICEQYGIAYINGWSTSSM